MKRSILFALFAAMLCILPSCAAQDTPETSPLSLRYQTTETVLTLGMTQAEVEAALSAEGIDPVDVTEPTEPHWSWMAIYGRGADQVSVMYEAETDTVDQLILYLEGDVTSNWNTRGGISLGSSQETIEKTYADTGSMANGTSLAYYYDADGKPSDASQVSQGDVLVALDLNDSDQVDHLCILQIPPENQMLPENP